ncbi:MAG: hypothetical protein ACLTZY_10260 [Alistipes indistinctus]
MESISARYLRAISSLADPNTLIRSGASAEPVIVMGLFSRKEYAGSLRVRAYRSKPTSGAVVYR